jgi:hypothetical protein
LSINPSIHLLSVSLLRATIASVNLPGHRGAVSQIEINDSKPPTLNGMESLLFEPEGPTTSSSSFSMPTAIIAGHALGITSPIPDPSTTDTIVETIDLSSLSDETTEGGDYVSPYIRKLRFIETTARQFMSGWAPKYLNQDPEATVAAPKAGSKRKGVF